MKVAERDDLLIRLDERSESFMRELKEQTEHLKILNGQTNDNTTRSNRNKTHINIQWWVISVLLLAATLKVVGVYLPTLLVTLK